MTNPYREDKSDHRHCPLGCEHPQPLVVDGVELCGRCLIKDGIKTKMVDCTPEICE